MARVKNSPESVKAKTSLAERLRSVRVELFGERGGPELARRLGLPVRTWYNYEAGVTVPAEVVLRVVELTGVDPIWLLHGTGARYRDRPAAMRGLDPAAPRPAAEASAASISVEELLRAALRRLESAGEAPGRPGPSGALAACGEVVLIDVEDGGAGRLTPGSGPSYLAAHREWLSAERDCRCVRVADDAMTPILGDGAYVAFAAEEDGPEALDGKLVVAWIEGRPMVRWYQNCGSFALLRAENAAAVPNTTLVDLGTLGQGERAFRRVIWINTPH